MEITLGDLLILEPRLVDRRGAVGAADPTPYGEGKPVSWAVTTRTTPPHLPLLRGGEVLLVPARVTAIVEDELPALLHEVTLRGVSAVVFERGDPALDKTYPRSDDVQLLEWPGDLTADTETAINRLLTECRGNLYQIGTELERQMADAASNHAGVEALVRIAAQTSGLPIIVLDAQGRRLASSPEENSVADDAGLAPSDCVYKRPLALGATLVLGPVRSEQSVVARFLIDRIAGAAGAALKRDEVGRPRGSRRGAATEALLSGRHASAADQRAAALALGFDPDAVYFVAVSEGASESAMARALAPLGLAHPAGELTGRRATLVVATGRTPAESFSSRALEVRRRWEEENVEGGPSLALSAPAVGVASIPAAAREANFVATMQSRSQLPRSAAFFASVGDVGAIGLLYQLRDSSELRRFVDEALGALESRDQRGTLRATLRAFFESGGSQVHASQRLGIHRNTLAYRLRRIGELVGCDVADPRSWLTLHLALRASEMLDVWSDEG